METITILLLWYASGLLSFPLFVWWWTRKLDFTRSELILFFVMSFYGPLHFLAHVLFCVVCLVLDNIDTSKTLFKKRK